MKLARIFSIFVVIILLAGMVTPALALTPPVITLPGGTITSVDGVITTLDAGATLSDDGANLNGGSLQVGVTANASPNDGITFTTGGAGVNLVTRSGTADNSTVSVGGNVIGTFTGYNTNSLVFTFTTNFATTATVQTLMRRMQINPNGNQNPPSSLLTRTVTYTINDGVDAPASAIKLVNVTSVNDVPTISGTTDNGWSDIGASGPAIFTENGGPIIIDTFVDSFADPDWINMGMVYYPSMVFNISSACTADDRLSVISTASITISGPNIVWAATGTTLGSFSGGGDCSTPLTITVITGTIGRMDDIVEAVTFNNVSEDPSITNRTVRLVVTDDFGASSAPVSKTVQVTAVNDLPTGANGNVTATEDTLYTFAPADFTFNDLDDIFTGIRVTSLETAGTLQCGGLDVALNGSCADVTTLTFLPGLSANGTGYASFGFQVFDGTAYSVASYTMTIDVTAVNDAPTGANDTVTATEDALYTFAPADFTFNDIDGDSLAGMRVTSLETAGTLQCGGLDVALNGICANMTTLTFLPVLNANGTGYASFGFQVFDGTAYSAASYTMTIDVTAANDAPTNIALSNSNIDENLSVNTAIGSFTSTDVDTGDTFTYSFVTGVTGCDSSGNGSFVLASDELRSNVIFDYETQTSYNICVQSTDNGSATFDKQFTISINDLDDTAPETTIDSTTPATTPTNNPNISISFSSEAGATFQCRLDSTLPGAYSSCTSPYTNPTALADGSHTFEVYATDTNGNPDLTPATYNWTVETVPPTLTIGAPSVTITNSGPVNFPITISGATTISLVAGNVTLNASGVTGTVSVTNGTTATPTVTVSGLSGNGTFTISIAAGVASDDASNTTAAAGPSAQVAVDNASVYILTNGTVGWPGNIVILNNGAYTNHFTSLDITFNKDVSDPAGNNLPDDVTNPANYLLVQYGPDKVFDTVSCSGGVLNDDVQIPTGPVSYNSTSFMATVTLNNGAALPTGYYRLYVCGTTSITDAAGNALNDGADSVYNFRIFDVSLPKTGFAPGVVTELPVQPAEKAYSITDVKLEIPSLGLSLAVVGVPQVGKGWDVSWLGNDAGWLDGSAFPSWEGNSVITGHVWDANNKPGPFQNIKSLKYGDQIKVYAYGKVYTYAVRENKLITTGNTSAVFKHEDKAWITLITCEDFNASKTSYDYRRIVRAVLLSVK